MQSQQINAFVVRFLAVFACLTMLLALLLATPGRAEELTEPGASDQLLLELSLEKQSAYPGERVTLTATLLVGAVTFRNIQYPRIGDGPFLLTPFNQSGQFAVTRNGSEIGVALAHASALLAEHAPVAVTPNRVPALAQLQWANQVPR